MTNSAVNVCRWTDGLDDEQILVVIFATRLTIFTPASLRDVEKEEGPAGVRINACRKLVGLPPPVPDVKTTSS